MCLRIHIPHLAFAALAVACMCSAAQKMMSAGTGGDSGAMVRLEAHAGQTQFTLGDPVFLDLVFTSQSPGYVVDTYRSPALPVHDLINISPDGGWVRTHIVLQGQGLNGNTLVTLGPDPVRVPILLNRAVTFEEPGHYEVRVTTERLLSADIFARRASAATTNVVGIDIVPRDESGEAALVADLSRELEDTKEGAFGSELSTEQKADFQREFEAARQAGVSSEAGKEQLASLQRKMNDAIAAELARVKERKEARRKAAIRLACLDGDAAVQAKVRFIVADDDGSDGDPVGFIMVNGLPSSSNKQLQLDLLEAAWRDPNHVPTSVLHNALREAKQLIHQPWVTDEEMLWAGTEQERHAALKEYQGEIDEIVATLPQRTEENRAETIHFLKGLAVPNQFNQRR